jgi:hypothetical protein
VSVEQSDLISAIFKLLYRSTLTSVITHNKIPVAAPRRFLTTLTKRKPCVTGDRTQGLSLAVVLCSRRASDPCGRAVASPCPRSKRSSGR